MNEEGITMLAKIKKELLFAGVFRNSNEKVRKDILEDNRKAAIFWGAIQLIFWSFSLVMSRIDPEYIDCLPVYITVLVICSVALLLALYVCPKHLRLVPAVATALNIALLGGGRRHHGAEAPSPICHHLLHAADCPGQFRHGYVVNDCADFN